MDASPDRRLQILLVDSHLGARRALAKRLLGHKQLVVIGDTANPLEAHDLVREHRPHVALIDPGGDAERGRRIMASLGSVADGGPLAVIHVAFFEPDLWSALQGAGAHGLVLKDLDVDALAARLFKAVMEMLPRERWPLILQS